jgi:hypothetical protein
MSMKRNLVWIFAGVLVLALAGCSDPTAENLEVGDVNGKLKSLTPPPSSVAAGVALPQVSDPSFEQTKTVANNKFFGQRRNPFALLPVEAKFERDQYREWATNELGGWFEPQYEVPDETVILPEERIVVEQQPYRRLSGVILGNGVAALIEMEDGRVYEIVPGVTIPGTNWTVVRIDSDTATLYRPGNTRPNTISVRLGPKGENLIPGTSGGGSRSEGGGGRGDGREGEGGEGASGKT